jgi:hypothetical protein
VRGAIARGRQVALKKSEVPRQGRKEDLNPITSRNSILPKT